MPHKITHIVALLRKVTLGVRQFATRIEDPTEYFLEYYCHQVALHAVDVDIRALKRLANTLPMGKRNGQNDEQFDHVPTWIVFKLTKH